MTWEEALQILKQGNERFVAGKLEHPNQTTQRREEVIPGQNPFAIVLTCSDSRTPPEIIFDRGIGDLFIIRTAGNIADDVAVGSMEIAVEEFGVPLIMVLGHQNCGAIKSAMKEADYSGCIPNIINRIKPAVQLAQGQPGNPQDNTAKSNVKLVVDQLKRSKPILSQGVEEGKLKIVGAYYWFDDGKVEIIIP